jgi:hypothetical protein
LELSEERIDSGTKRRVYGDLLILQNHEIPHNVPNCCWKIEIGSKTNPPDLKINQKINSNTKTKLKTTKYFYATDTNNLKRIEAKDYDLYMVEANYEEEEMLARIKKKREKDEYVYETGIPQRHLSKKKALAWIAENIGDEGKYILMHVHEEKRTNNKYQITNNN